MRRILVFGDSNTWGYISGTFDWVNFTYDQFPFHQRWPGILQNNLGPRFNLIEEALPGRTIMTDDAHMPGSNGLAALKNNWPQYGKLDLVIIMLGSNDLKSAYQLSPQKITEQMAELCFFIQTQVPQILLIAPPQIQLSRLREEWRQIYQNRDIDNASRQLAACYQDFANRNHYLFFDASSVTLSEESDGLHLDALAHQWLADKLTYLIKDLKNAYRD